MAPDPPLSVRIPHRLGKEEAVRRLKTGMAAAAAKVPILSFQEQTWDGSQLSFRVAALGQVAVGTLDVQDEHVDVQVRLPWLLQKFAQKIVGAVEQRGKLLLEKK